LIRKVSALKAAPPLCTNPFLFVAQYFHLLVVSLCLEPFLFFIFNPYIFAAHLFHFFCAGFAKVIGESDEDLNTHTILGWEIIGEGANELVQLCGVLVGQVMEDVANTQFSAVTMAAAAQIACEDCLRKGEQKGELGRSRPILR